MDVPLHSSALGQSVLEDFQFSNLSRLFPRHLDISGQLGSLLLLMLAIDELPSIPHWQQLDMRCG
jgi:hypothetical protein